MYGYWLPKMMVLSNFYESIEGAKGKVRLPGLSTLGESFFLRGEICYAGQGVKDYA